MSLETSATKDVAAGKERVLPWKSLRKTAQFASQGMEDTVKAHAQVVLREVMEKMQAEDLPVELRWGPKKGTRVVATRDIATGELKIPPHATRHLKLINC